MEEDKGDTRDEEVIIFIVWEDNMLDETMVENDEALVIFWQW